MDLNKLTMGDKIVAGGGIVLIISLLFFPWHRVSFFGFTETIGATSAPNAIWGILSLIVAIALVAVVLAEKLGNVSLPDLPIPWNDAKFFATIAIVAMLALKLVLETEFLGWGAWISLIVSAAMVYGGFLIKKEGASASSTPPSSF